MKKKRERPVKSQSSQSTSRRPFQNLLCLIIVCVAGIVAYWNTFDVPLVFDDLPTIQWNTGVQFGDYLNPSTLFSRSVLYLTFAVNYSLGGQDVWGYHLVNLALHLLDGILIYF